MLTEQRIVDFCNRPNKQVFARMKDGYVDFIIKYTKINGRTKEIDEQYQHLLLLSKADRIEENLTDASVQRIYKFSNFAFVLNVGLDVDNFSDVQDMDFPAITNAINVYYGNKW